MFAVNDRVCWKNEPSYKGTVVEVKQADYMVSVKWDHTVSVKWDHVMDKASHEHHVGELILEESPRLIQVGDMVRIVNNLQKYVAAGDMGKVLEVGEGNGYRKWVRVDGRYPENYYLIEDVELVESVTPCGLKELPLTENPTKGETTIPAQDDAKGKREIVNGLLLLQGYLWRMFEGSDSDGVKMLGSIDDAVAYIERH